MPVQDVNLLGGGNALQIIHGFIYRELARKAPTLFLLNKQVAPTLGYSSDYLIKKEIPKSFHAGVGPGLGDFEYAPKGGSYDTDFISVLGKLTGISTGIAIGGMYATELKKATGDYRIKWLKLGDTITLATKRAALAIHKVLAYEFYRGTLAHYVDDGATYGPIFGQGEIVNPDGTNPDPNGFTARGDIGFFSLAAGTTLNITTGAPTPITLNDHNTNAGRVGAYYLNEGDILAVFQRTGAQAYSLVGYVRVVKKYRPSDPNTNMFPDVIDVVAVGADFSVGDAAAATYYYLIPAVETWQGTNTWINKFDQAALSVSIAAEDQGIIQGVNKANVPLFTGTVVIYDTTASLYQNLLELIDATLAKNSFEQPQTGWRILMHPFYLEVLKDEVRTAAVLDAELGDLNIPGVDLTGHVIKTVYVRGVPVVPEPFVGPGMAILIADSNDLRGPTSPITWYYLKPAGEAPQFDISPDIDFAQDFKVEVSLPPFLSWGEAPGPDGLGPFKRVPMRNGFYNYVHGYYNFFFNRCDVLAKLIMIPNGRAHFGY